MAADKDTVNESVDEDTMDAEENQYGNSFVESNHAFSADRSEENSRNDRKDSDRNSLGEWPNAAVHETHLDQEPSSVVDPDDLEMEEDDITSKLLSIQVLPRIPKRKPATDNNPPTSVGESSSYCSVLERVNSAPGSEVARYPNWSAAGWRRSNIDRPLKRWSRELAKDGKAELKPIKRTPTEKVPSRDSKHRTEVTDNKLKRAAEHSAWSVDESDVSSCASASDIERPAADESAAPSSTGPLPTLPFEEQMRERARLRNLKKQGVSDAAHSSSNCTEAASKNICIGDVGGYLFDTAAAQDFHADKAETSQPVISEGQHDMAFPGSVNSTLSLRAESAEHHQSSQHSRSENGHRHVHSAKKPNHQANRMYAKDKRNQLHSTGAQDTEAFDSVPKSRRKTSSPPLPHLPVLPLFAASDTQASDSILRQGKHVSTSFGKRFVTASGQNTSAQNDVHDVSSSIVSKLKPASSAAAGVKSVTFSSDAVAQDGGKTMRKSKPKVGQTICFPW